MQSREILDIDRPQVSQKDVHRLELVSPHKEGWASFHVAIGKPGGPLAECYRPVGSKQVMTHGFIKCGFYYGGSARGQFRIWQHGRIKSRRKFKGQARFMWWLNKEYCGTITVDYQVDRQGVEASAAHDFGVVDFD